MGLRWSSYGGASLVDFGIGPSGAVSDRPQNADDTYLMALTHDGRSLITIDTDNTIRRWDLTARQPEKSAVYLKRSGGNQIFNVKISTDDRWLIAWGVEDKILVWDLRSKIPSVHLSCYMGTNYM